jgi:hypothetical protein
MRIKFTAGVAMLAMVVGAAPALAAPNGPRHLTGTGSFSGSQVIVPDAENLSSAYLVDVPEGYKGGEFDRINIVDDNGQFTLRHESVPDGQVTCDFTAFAQFRGNPGQEQTWVEELESTGSAVGDGGFVCYASNWGGNQQQTYSLRFGDAQDPGTGCWEISKNEDGSYVLTAPAYSAERTETTTYPGEPGLPLLGGGTPDRTETTTYPAEGCEAELWHITTEKGRSSQTKIADEVSAPFIYNFTFEG